MKAFTFCLLALAFILVDTNGLFAQQLVYQPVNPSFGGNPLNGNWLLSSAQLQDNTTDPSQVDQVQDPFADFQNNLSRSILSQLSRNLTNQLFGESGELQEGLFQIGDFSIEILETLDGVQITIFDLLTGNETILLVEDDSLIKEAVAQSLRNAGYTVLSAETPATALEIAAYPDRSIDLLITDVLMPGGMDGKVLADRLLASRQDLKTLFISGHPEAALKAGIDVASIEHFLQKPFSLDTLLLRIRKTLQP